MKSAGNASITVLILVFALSTVFLAAASFSGALARLILGLDQHHEERAALAAAAAHALDLLSRDPTPEADSRLDPVWAESAFPSLPGAVITLSDLSSRVNVNTASSYLLSAVKPFREGKTFEAFQKFRLERGPFPDAADGPADYFTEEALEKTGTAYAFFNVNTADESMLFLMFELRTGKKAADTPFAAAVKSRRAAKGFFTQADLKTLLGEYADRVYPFIGAQPEMNVNLMDPDLLGAVLNAAKTYYKVPLIGNPRDAIVSMREGAEITPALLATLIKPQFTNTILESYLGCRTWFWEIKVTRKNAVYRAVAVRLPPPIKGTEKGARFRLAAESFVPAGPGGSAETETADE